MNAMLKIWLFAVLTMAGSVAPGIAQNYYKPVYTINGQVVSEYDISQRVRILQAFGGSGDTSLRATAIEQLIDDRLRETAAQQIGLTLDADELEAGAEEFSQNRGVTSAQMLSRLGSNRVFKESFYDLVKAQLLWRKVVQRRFRARATPSESDLDSALNIAASAAREQVLLSEILLANAERGEAGTMALAQRLSRQLNNGGNFGAAARKYSRGGSARRGGRLGWTPVENLPPAVAGQVLALLPGEVTAPIPFPAGVAILKVTDIREDNSNVDKNVFVSWARLVIPLAQNASKSAVTAAQSKADSIASEIDDCVSMSALVGEFGEGSGREEPMELGKVPKDIGLVLARLDPREVSTDLRDARGINVIMLCNRSVEVDPDARETLRNRLFGQRIESFARGYLQELRADAVIIEQ